MSKSTLITRFIEAATGIENLTASTVTDEQLDELESTIGMELPPLYRNLLKACHYDHLTERPIRFCPHPAGSWRGELESLYHDAWLPERIIGAGLIPFADETLAEAGPVCFDTRRRLSDGDCPVILWDHEWVGTQKEVQLLFSSTEAMFRCLTFIAEQDVDFIQHDEGYDPEDALAEKARLMKEYLNLDPDGVGGEGREYWTCWGVNPAA